MGIPLKGTNILGPILPFNTDDIYASHLAKYGNGGWRTVKNLNERDSILEARREQLMLVATQDNSYDSSSSGIAFYILDPFQNNSTSTNLMDNNNWIPLDFGYGNDGWVFPPPTQTHYIGTKGQRSFDNNYLYICVENGLWKRTVIDFFIDGSGTNGASFGTSGLGIGTVPIWNGNGYDYRIVVEKIEQIGNGELITYTNGTSSYISFGTSGGGSGVGDLSYIRSTPTTVSIGGYPSGSIPNFSDIRLLLDAILYPFIAPGIGISSSTLHEKGTSVTKSVSYSINPNSATVSSRQILLNGSVVNSPVSNNGNYTVTTTLTWANSPIGGALYSSHTVTYRVNYSNYAQQNASILVEFVPATYKGVLSLVNINEANVKTLSKSIRKKANDSGSFSPNLQRYIYAYPASFGNLTSVIDQNGFNVTASFTSITTNFTLPDSTLESYKIYYSTDDTTQTAFGLTFNF